MPYYGFSSYPSCALPQQPRYACVINPQQMVGYPMSSSGYHHHQHVKSPVQPLPTNGYHYPHLHHMIPTSSTHNGYAVPQPASSISQSYNCVVPTGQLIELDSTSPAAPSRSSRVPLSHVDELKSPENRNGNAVGVGERCSNNVYSDGGLSKRESPISSRMDMKSVRPTTLEDLRPRKNGLTSDPSGPIEGELFSHLEKFGSSKQSLKPVNKKSGVPAVPMQDGTGTWESWDYVYRNLENQGYNKDVGERGDILHTSTFPRRGSIGSAGSSPNVNSTVLRNR